MTLQHLVLTITLVLLVASADGQEPDKRRAGATYVFLGTVASSETGRPPGAKADAGVVVVVDQIYLQKGTFDDQTGRRVEVAGAPAALREKAQYVFYTEPVRFGQRIVVQLIDVSESGGAAAAQQGAKMKQDASDAYTRREIEERAALAELVIVGAVTEVRQLERAPARESEHLPDFHVARVKPDRALKGKAPAGELEFIFAASKDVQWFRAPKFRVGDRGAFFLQRAGQDLVSLGADRQRLTLLHPLDYRPIKELSIVEAVLKGAVK